MIPSLLLEDSASLGRFIIVFILGPVVDGLGSFLVIPNRAMSSNFVPQIDTPSGFQ
jgi:hypothetical protein